MDAQRIEEKIKKIIFRRLPKDYQVFLFGSVARGEAGKTIRKSDKIR